MLVVNVVARAALGVFWRRLKSEGILPRSNADVVVCTLRDTNSVYCTVPVPSTVVGYVLSGTTYSE